jgi:hypothetical protein
MKIANSSFTRACLVAAIGFLHVGPVQAYSGFTRSQGGLYTKLTYGTFTSNDFYDLEGNLNNRGEDFTQRSVALYVEYGVLDSLDLVVEMPLVRMNSFSNSGTAVGIGDLRLTAKYGVEVAGFRIAAMLSPEIPTGDSGATVKTETGLNLLLPTGDGEFNLWSRLALSRSFPSIHAYVNLDFGYNLRTDGFSDQIAFGAEAGYKLLDYLWLSGHFRGQLVPSDELRPSGGFIFGEGTEFLSAGAGIAVPLPYTPLSITFDWDQIFAAQKNIYGGATFLFGFSGEFDVFPNE